MMTKTMNHSLAVAAVVTAMAFGVASPAHASLMFNVTEVDPSVGSSAEQDFLNTFIAGPTTESFEGFKLGDAEGGAVPGPVSSSVGTFTGTGVGDPTGSCVAPCDRLQILDQDSSPFNGRFAVELGGTVDTKDAATGDTTGQWLDSNDISQVVWDLAGVDSDYNAFGFYLMDGADQGAVLDVTFADSSSQQVQLAQLTNKSNGTLYYMAGVASQSILNASVTFENTAGNTLGDGFGIDRVSIGQARVPAPATLGLLGAGLLGLGLIGRGRRG
jgi:hypothetical protein